MDGSDKTERNTPLILFFIVAFALATPAFLALTPDRLPALIEVRRLCYLYRAATAASRNALC